MALLSSFSLQFVKTVGGNEKKRVGVQHHGFYLSEVFCFCCCCWFFSGMRIEDAPRGKDEEEGKKCWMVMMPPPPLLLPSFSYKKCIALQYYKRAVSIDVNQKLGNFQPAQLEYTYLHTHCRHVIARLHAQLVPINKNSALGQSEVY